MRVGLAQTRFPKSAAEGLDIVKKSVAEAAANHCDIICFPESIIPGLRGVGYAVEEYDHNIMQAAIQQVSVCAKDSEVAVILPMEWKDSEGDHLVAFVISEKGEILGYQTKNQYDPDEDGFGYVPGTARTLFEIRNVKFGIVICHEGWRYPETVRWAAQKGATIVFHPQFTGDVTNPDFFKAAMVCRSLENNIYFASVNYALPAQTCTTALISPNGDRLAVASEEKEELLVWDIDPKQATRLLANRYNPNLF